MFITKDPTKVLHYDMSARYVMTCQRVTLHRLTVVYNHVTVDTISRKEIQDEFRLTICLLSSIDLQINFIRATTKILFPSSMYSNFHSSEHSSHYP